MHRSFPVSRRALLAALAGGSALTLRGRAAAQIAPTAGPTAGCTIGFVNGLLTIGGTDCGLLQPPGLEGATIAPPSTLAPPGEASLGGTAPVTSTDGTTTSTDGTTTSTSTGGTVQEARAEHAQQRRQKKRDKRGRKSTRHHDRKNRRQTAQQDQRSKRAINRTTCDDFTYQEEAQAWHTSHFGSKLIPNSQGKVCPQLPSIDDVP